MSRACQRLNPALCKLHSRVTFCLTETQKQICTLYFFFMFYRAIQNCIKLNANTWYMKNINFRKPFTICLWNTGYSFIKKVDILYIFIFRFWKKVIPVKLLRQTFEKWKRNETLAEREAEGQQNLELT